MGSAAAEAGIAEGHEALASGNWTAARSAFEAALDVEEFPPTGCHVSAESAEVFRIVDGKIAGYWCLTNVAGLMRQLTEEPVAVASAGG